MLNAEIKAYLNRSVLVWLATSSLENIPNVSPKEAFLPYLDECIIIANIASPQTVKNIKENNQVCLSFIDIFSQKGCQLKGEAAIITNDHSEYKGMKMELEKLTNGKFPFSSITKIIITSSKRIIAPSYFLYPETTESDQIKASMKTYQIKSFTFDQQE